MLALLLLSLASAAATAPATHTRTYCDVRSGTAGNAYLDAQKQRDSLTLAEQGRSQRLLEEIDSLVSPEGRETGTQNGKRYCAVVELDASDGPVKVVKAWRQHK